MPETMLIMAIKCGLEHCEVRKEMAVGGRAVVEKEPGTMRMSN
jgi:hypothetical protein